METGKQSVLRFALIATCFILSGCGLYLHDARLTGPAAKADDSLSKANTLAPFDQQLGILQSFAQEEDRAVATYWTSARNADLARLLATGNPQALSDAVRLRLERLVGANATDQSFTASLSVLVGDRTRERDLEQLYEGYAQDYRLQYDRLKPAGDTANTACPVLRDAVPEAEADRLTTLPDPLQQARGRMAKNCWEAGRARAAVEAVDATIARSDGELKRALTELRQTEAEIGSPGQLSQHAVQLQAEVTRAEAYAKNGGAEADLAEFRNRVGELLGNVGIAARLAGWTKISDDVDKLLRAEVCAAEEGEVDADTLTAADCGNVSPTSTTGRAAATWAFAEAVAALVQANSPRSRSAQWLLAAKAIIAAEKAAARLQLAEARLRGAAQLRRLEAMLREVSALHDSRAVLAGGSVPTCTGAAYSCGFATYAEAWNQGRLPAEVLLYRPIQLTREYAVRRARAVAEKQRALALAGTGSLRAYAAGGLQPEAVAQALIDLGILGVNVGN